MTSTPDEFPVSREEYELLHAIAYSAAFVADGGVLAPTHLAVMRKPLAALNVFHEARRARAASAERAA